ncbi:hypothetical protein FS837_008392 [Tulasnella sp. UAMH 9824]|nr:hypothetical protein FS837_008392 [Tulasnella sp. UAMH 9824]
MIVAKVSLGKVSVHYRTTQHLRAPPSGYDSQQLPRCCEVLGDVGLDLNYDEQVLYKNEAVRPAYVVIYARPVVSGAPTYRMPRSAAQITLSNTAAKATAAAAAAAAAATTTRTTTIFSSNSPRCTIM